MEEYKNTQQKQFQNIVSIHKSIIRSFELQKVRNDELLEKYKDAVDEEFDLPSNKFLHWTKIIQPYLDSVITSKLSDYDLITQYKQFVKDLISYQANYLISEEEVDNLNYYYDTLIEKVLKLEYKIKELKKIKPEEKKEVSEIHQDILEPKERTIKEKKELRRKYKGKVLSEEHKMHIAEAMRGAKHTKQHKKNIRNGVLKVFDEKRSVVEEYNENQQKENSR